MKQSITLLAAFGLLSVFGGCASYPSDSYSGYGGPSGYHSHSNHSENHHQDGPSKQETAVKALQGAAKSGADPSSTLYQQMLIQQH